MAEKLTASQREVLNELEWSRYGSSCPQEWSRPLDIGGHNGSHHSSTLAALERKGLTISRQRSAHMSRGSKVYQITEAGRAALKEGET